MFIESIDVRDFRGIESVTAELAPLTVIRGDNHKGKTSVVQSFQLGLTGRAKGTDGQGRGAKDKIRRGAKKAHIHMTLRGKNDIKMPFGVTYGPGATGRQIVTNNPPSFMAWLDHNVERLSCAFDSAYFVRQKPEDQKSILASLVLPTQFDFSQTIREEVAAHLGPYAKWDGNPVQVIDEIYDLAFEARKKANAESNGILIPQLPPKPAHTVEQIKRKLAELRARQSKLAAPAPSAAPSVELGRLQEQLKQATEKLDNATRDAETLRASLTDIEADILDPLDFKTYTRVAGHRAEYDSLDARLQDIINSIEAQREVEVVYQDLRQEKCCPTCHQPIPEAFINARIREAKETAATLGNEHRELMQEQKDLGDIEEAEKMLAAHEAAETKKAAQQTELGNTVGGIAQLRSHLRSLEEQIEHLKVPEDPPTTTPELDELNGQITRVEAELEPSIAYETAVANIEKAVERKRGLEGRIAALEKLTKYFGKDGIKATLIKENIDNFERSVNRVLAAWGYKASLSIDPYTFDVTLPGGITLPLKELSGSEEMMFSVALQTAIAHHSGIKIVAVDNADTFIEEERNRLFGCVSKLVADGVLQQAIVCVADSRTTAPQREGVVYYAAQAGKLVRL